jgi:hypothetical protein
MDEAERISAACACQIPPDRDGVGRVAPISRPAPTGPLIDAVGRRRRKLRVVRYLGNDGARDYDMDRDGHRRNVTDGGATVVFNRFRI